MFQKTSGLITAGLALTLAASLAWSQAPSPKPGGSGGIATGGTFPATFDSEHRPITAGGFVKTGPIVFMNTAQKAGLTAWTHKMGTPEKRFILEANGSGVALLDYDNDGWLDIYLVNGSTVDALDGKEPSPHAALFHNNHDGTFTDVAAKAGVTNDRWGLRRRQSATTTTTAGPTSTSPTSARTASTTTTTTAPSPTLPRRPASALGNWSTGATFGDYDGDGRLDLFVAGYVHFDSHNPPAAGHKGRRLRLLPCSAASPSCAVRAASKASPTISSTTTATAPSPT